jgi:hypothetical protein
MKPHVISGLRGDDMATKQPITTSKFYTFPWSPGLR